MAAPTVLQQLIEQLMKGDQENFTLQAWIEGQRAASQSWQQIAFTIYAKTGRLVTPETIRLWAEKWKADAEDTEDTTAKEASPA